MNKIKEKWKGKFKDLPTFLNRIGMSSEEQEKFMKDLIPADVATEDNSDTDIECEDLDVPCTLPHNGGLSTKTCTRCCTKRPGCGQHCVTTCGPCQYPQ